MVSVTKLQGTIITAVLGVLLGCGGLLACGNVLTSLVYVLQASAGTTLLGTVSNLFLITSGLCTSAGFIAIPVIFWFLLVRGRPDDPAGMG